MGASQPTACQLKRAQQIVPLLQFLLHPDVIPVVVGYEATIQFELVSSLGGTKAGNRDGEMNTPQGLVLYDEELFVMDTLNHRIQVFHQVTGRFLRKWWLSRDEEGSFCLPVAAAISLPTSITQRRGEAENVELFVLDQEGDIQVFGIVDCRLRHRIPMPYPAMYSRGIGVARNQIFISRYSPNRIDILTKSDGKRINTFGDKGFGQVQFHVPEKLWPDPETNELFIADSQNRILVLNMVSGKYLRQYGPSKIKSGGVKCAGAVVVHGTEVIVADTSHNRLVVFHRSTSRPLRTIDLPCSSSLSVQVSDLCDLAVSCRNQLFVCNSGNHSVMIFE